MVASTVRYVCVDSTSLVILSTRSGTPLLCQLRAQTEFFNSIFLRLA